VAPFFCWVGSFPPVILSGVGAHATAQSKDPENANRAECRFWEFSRDIGFLNVSREFYESCLPSAPVSVL
jgi:hypothetical protein